MSKKLKINLLSLFSITAITPLLGVTLSNCSSKTSSIDCSEVNKTSFGWLNDATMFKYDLKYTGFKFSGNLFELKINVTNLNNFDGYVTPNIVATSNNTFDVVVTFVGNNPLQGSCPTFDLVFSNIDGKPQSEQLVSGFSASFSANILNIINELKTNQTICTQDSETSILLSGTLTARWGSTIPIEDLSSFYVEIAYDGKKPSCNLTPSIIPLSVENGEFGIKLDASNITTNENLPVRLVIKNNLLEDWSFSTSFALNISNKVEDGFEITYDEESSTAVINNILVADESIRIPETITHDNKVYTVTEIILPGTSLNFSYPKVKSLFIPKTIKEILNLGNRTKTYPNLESISVDEENTKFKSKVTCSGQLQESNCLLDSTGKQLILAGSKFKMPDGITQIYHDAFANRKGITEITIPSTVTTVGTNAFENCTDLISVDMSAATIDKLATSCFSNCNKLVNFKFPQNITLIGTNVFDHCTSLASITIPSTVTNIWPKAFNYCSSLTSLTIPKAVTTLGAPLTNGCAKITELKVEDANEGGYTSKINSTEANCVIKAGELIATCEVTDVSVLNSITSIGGSAFSENSKIKNITIPSTVTSIGKEAFYKCPNLETIDMSLSSIIEIPTNCFFNCVSLSNVKMPDTVLTIGNSAFRGCISLQNIELSDALLEIKVLAFANCTNLRKIEIHQFVTEIPIACFANCYSLQEVTLSSLIKRINGYAFFNCKSLTSITIPYIVVNIGWYAFQGCDNLKEATFEKWWSWAYGFEGEGVKISEYITTNLELSAELLKTGEQIGNFGNK